MSIDAKRRYAAAAFVTLLLLSVFWPSPIVSSNVLWFGADLDIDHLSFLGREAPSWDVVFWCIAGLLMLAILQSAEAWDFREPFRCAAALRWPRGAWLHAGLALLAGAIVTAAVWLLLDMRALALAETIRTDAIEDVIRIVNRFGGGMNPVMVAIFFLVAGVAYREQRWTRYAIAMAISGPVAGLTAAIFKQLVGRARPELWLGPTHYAPGASTSFPSGHTVGAFALAGVLIFGARSRSLRIAALVLASAVAAARVLAFRHWLSDVTASAFIGLVTAWLVWRAVRDTERGSELTP